MKVVRYFSAPWCAPCTRMRPLVEKLCADRGLVFEFHNIERAPDFAAKNDVRGVPTIDLFRDGSLVDRVNPGASWRQVKERVEKL